ncbi:MAG: methyltransferase domain-containing protein [Candidatus Brocadiaceae bacterium]|nr:methyltransferase domain-containing protein [Candidatus Brocadiaceae bacterium]
MAHEFDGRRYEQASTHQKEWGAVLIAELALQGDECVLDLGSGDGTLTARIADLVPRGQVVGIDASQGMIDAALPKARPNLQFLRMDINEIDFQSRFDVVVSNATLHWVKDHRRLLANVRRALRPAGHVRFNFAGEGNCSHFFRVVREAMATERFALHFARFEWPWYMPPLEEYAALVAESGPGEARVWAENADRFFPDVDAMVRWVDQPSLVPFLARVPAGEKEALRAHVIRRMIEETRRPDGRCFETFRRINLSAST